MTSISQAASTTPQASSSASPSPAPASSSSPSTSGPASNLPAAQSSGRTAANATKIYSSHASTAALHGKSGSVGPMNGKSSLSPAVPVMGAPTIVNGNAPGQSDHSRKASVTISAAGTSGQLPNGGMASGKPAVGNNIVFGSINSASSPAIAHSIPQPGHSPASLSVASASNPRITSPQNSPSPIPQPAASGGRPPAGLQGNGPNFGSLQAGGEDVSRSLRSGMPSAALSPSMQAAHLRRESSQSMHADAGNPNMGPNSGRGGYGQGGRGGRGYNQQYPQQMPHSPNPNYRGPAPNAPRGGQGMPQAFNPQGARIPTPSYQQSPHQASRSPSFTNTQPMPGQMPINSPGMPQTPYGGYPQQMGPPQQVYPPFPDAYSLHAFSIPKRGGKKFRGGGVGGGGGGERWDRGGERYDGGSYERFERNGSYESRPSIAHAQRRTDQTPPLPIPLYIATSALPRPDLSPASGQFENFLTQRKQNQYGSMPGYDPNYAAYYYSMNPQMQAGFMSPAPQSARFQQHPTMQQQQYTVGQYNPTTMSRTSSAISDRPGSTVPPTPMTPAMNTLATASRGAASPAPKTTDFKIPVRKAAVLIKDPASGAVKTFDRPPASPAPVPPSKSPVIASTSSSPAPPTPKVPETPRAEAKVKSADEKASEMRAAVARKIKADEAEEERLKKEAEEASQKKAAEEVAASSAAVEEPEAEKESEKAAPEEPTVEKPSAEDEAAEKARKEAEEEAYWARIDKEEEEKEAKREAEYQEKKRKEREEAARKAEREAEAAEELRLKRLEDENNDDTDREERMNLFRQLGKAAPATAVTPDVETPGDSGTETPKSEKDSMPPPKALPGNKQKPAALKLKTSESVEAPQPSAALQSLRSARFLTSINDVKYPESIASPNPALNSGAAMGKFRYDKTFLLQFQPVFVEKPSETWTEKVKETVGDASDVPQSARRANTGNMSARSASSRGPMPGGNAFQSTGGFGAFTSQARTLPPGTTSADRYNASLKGPSARPGAFPVGNFGAPQMARQVSATAFSGHPQSPRNNPSQRGAARGSKGGKRENDKDAKSMPLTAGMDLKPIEVSATGWKPRSVGAAAQMAGPPPGGDGYLAPDVVQRKVKAALNKMTPSTFEKISTQILDIVAQSKKETDGRTLRQVIQLTFEKATDEAHWAQMYAEWCGRMLTYMTPEIRDETIAKDKHGNVPSGTTLFRKYLLNRCQEDFESGWKAKLPDKPAEAGEEEVSPEAAMLSDEYYIAAAAKRRGLGLVRFIGELFKLGMLTSRIMMMCVQRLLEYDGMPDEAEIESLTSLLKTIGENLDNEEKLRPSMDVYFQRINDMIKIPGLPSRLQFMLMDIVDMRKKGWKTKSSATKGPATLEEIRLQALEDERQKDIQRAQDNSRRGGGGGGRPGVGRGDARNFSGGGQFMPPPDYNRNTVGMDDLRRLGRGGSRQASTQGPTLGPTSMFGPRGSNTRKPMGPGGLLSRGAEDSGASSRTATPPAKKEEATTSMNAFSALATLEGESDALSPPSAPNSPPAKVQPLSIERASSPSKEAATRDA